MISSPKTISLDEVLKDLESVNKADSSAAGETVRSTSAEDEVQPSSVCCLLRIHPLELGHPRIDLEDSETVFGRDEHAKVTIDDPSVSRKHAVIERLRSLYVVSDLGSTNGTYVNGKAIESQPLKSGDRVRMGDQIFKFMEVDGVEAQYHDLVYDNMTRDGLTGAFNKRYFTDVLERKVSSSGRSNEPVSLILIDIDHFKDVNDTHGHLAGDQVLQELVRRLTETLRVEEILARYGGEEFAILLDDPGAADAVAERCRKVIESSPFETTAGSLPITISVGIATRAGNFKTDELVTASDAQLYRAKHEGRNRICVDPDAPTDFQPPTSTRR